MLFKITDHNNNLIKYKSICCKNEDMGNISRTLFKKFKNSDDKLFTSIIDHSFNHNSYRGEQMVIIFNNQINYRFPYIKLIEMISPKRQKEINEYNLVSKPSVNYYGNAIKLDMSYTNTVSASSTTTAYINTQYNITGNYSFRR